MAGLYIHIPFCKSRCIYCGFYSTTLLTWRDRYVDALCKEMALRPASSPLSTIYLGGGTPSLLTPRQLEQLFLNINKVYGCNPLSADKDSIPMEITIECNPDDITPEFAKDLAQLPVNRVSMGAQTFNDDRLRFLRRRHNSQQISLAMQRLRQAGIGNVSIDLMFGFPQETLEEWETDIRQALALQPDHISAYSLMYEEGTPLYDLKARSQYQEDGSGVTPVDEETELHMYSLLTDRLAAAGYEHYEISNWARPGYRSRHNSSYWQGVPYIGIGAAAHSFDLLTRSWNVSNLFQYMKHIEQGQLPSEQETLDDDTRYNDLITTALRTCEGICLDQIEEKYRSYLLDNAQSSLTHGLLTIDNGRIRLTRQGLFVSDDVMSDLIYV